MFAPTPANGCRVGAHVDLAAPGVCRMRRRAVPATAHVPHAAFMRLLPTQTEAAAQLAMANCMACWRGEDTCTADHDPRLRRGNSQNKTAVVLVRRTSCSSSAATPGPRSWTPARCSHWTRFSAESSAWPRYLPVPDEGRGALWRQKRRLGAARW
jgi:hypothetical protein